MTHGTQLQVDVQQVDVSIARIGKNYQYFHK
jgi:hypothetical protein